MSCETAHNLPITTGEFLLSSSIDTFPTSTVKSYLKYPDTISQQKCFTFFITAIMLCYNIIYRRFYNALFCKPPLLVNAVLTTAHCVRTGVAGRAVVRHLLG
ncbi:hypothetical protein DT73_25740 [Mangrovibacter sp. MFB070]|nr:hypothetical protein DT73_25740 [Mangrovibacter sp. MFB070]